MTGPHLGAVFPEPLPIARQHAVNDVTLGFDASVRVAIDPFFHEVVLGA
jgi:hypothetical protein